MRALERSPDQSPLPTGLANRRPARVGLLLLALAGAAIASYLALVQVGAIAHVWDPWFGERSSRAVLTSSLSRALPVPDAALGAVGYLLEGVLAFAGTTRRFGGSRAIAVACGVIAAGLLAAAGLLVAMQAGVVHAFCSLCLASAAISVVAAAIAIPDGLAALRADRSNQSNRPTEIIDRRSHP